FKKIREGATTFVSQEKSPKKEGIYPKREIFTNRLQKTTKVSHKLQRLDIDYKCLLFETTQICSVRFFSLPVCSVCFLRLQKFVVHFSDI
ncbi:hypothetical protein K443DRAFT_110932, partial [Laccaria amethystina LaAM-08-1]